jgi:hypothetical protein
MSDANHCDLCGAELESRGDCSNQACWSHANINHDLLRSAKARTNLSITQTGGGFDYISRVLWDNGPEMILHRRGDEPASPEDLADAAEVWLFADTNEWDKGEPVRFCFDTSVEAMDFMAGFTTVINGVALEPKRGTLYNIIPETKDGVQMLIMPEPVELGRVSDVIAEWKARYAHQGYFSNCNREHLYLDEMVFALVPVTDGEEEA